MTADGRTASVASIPLDRWPDVIESVLARECQVLHTLTLLRETTSTQDAARAAGAPLGTVVAAWRQTRGRGRLGRTWVDTGLDGVALTCVVPRAEPERLAIASAVATADAVATFGGAAARVGIKWPNDLVLDGRKLAGVLVEQGPAGALVGIGVNVTQQEFPEPVAGHAVSLAQAGVIADRLNVLCEIVRALDRWLRAPIGEITANYRARDQLTGRHAAFSTPEGRVEGEVLTVDPLRGLLVSTPLGEKFLPASTTSVVPPTP